MSHYKIGFYALAPNAPSSNHPECVPALNPVQLITSKRDGLALSASDIRSLVDAYTADRLPDYQMSAFLMAAFLRGLDASESRALTEAMLESGITVKMDSVPGIKVDKHSTGGVGDKISIALAPLVASCGVPVPMISGHGLGHSGGTLDKLASIPGFSTDLSLARYEDLVGTIGVAMIGQTDEIAPADRRIYALRDVTGTVEYAPFITASIMSKKLAGGSQALALDVKCGRGAFMQDLASAKDLTRMLCDVAARFNYPTVALITRMDDPLGYAVGNWPEVAEAIRVLKGDVVPDITELTLALAGEMLLLGGVASSVQEGLAVAQSHIDDGSAFAKMTELVLAQGGDPWSLDQPEPHRTGRIEVQWTGNDGFIKGIDARAVGYLAVEIGAGRLSMNDRVDPAAGIIFELRAGDEIKHGDLVATILTNKTDRAESFEKRLVETISVSPDPVDAGPLILDRYRSSEVG